MPQFDPKIAFRAFDDRAHAIAFCRGHIRLSTLTRCRAIEDVQRRDVGEGEIRWQSGSLDFGQGGPDDYRQIRAARRLHIEVPPGSGWRIENCMAVENIGNANLLCLSEDAAVIARKFGQYVAEIPWPRRLLLCVNDAFEREGNRQNFAWGRVNYTGRDVNALAEPQAPIGFLKEGAYADERELRMLWAPLDPRIEIKQRDMSIDVSDLGLCVIGP